MGRPLNIPPTPLKPLSPAALQSATKIRILRLPDVISRVGLKRASIYQYVSDGNFPKPVSLGPRAVGWIETEIDLWIFKRVQISRGCDP
jgi:prophage regulatory protein